MLRDGHNVSEVYNAITNKKMGSKFNANIYVVAISNRLTGLFSTETRPAYCFHQHIYQLLSARFNKTV